VNLIKKYFLFFLICFVTKQSLFSQVTNPNGYNTFYYDNGAKSSEGLMRDGKADGYWKNYYKNGVVKIEGNRKNFQLDSVWKFYSEKGKITKAVNYLEGKKKMVILLTMIQTYVYQVKKHL
jgi:antitoxin component YwqK of YwqJK toxin-antitoxin module